MVADERGELRQRLPPALVLQQNLEGEHVERTIGGDEKRMLVSQDLPGRTEEELVEPGRIAAEISGVESSPPLHQRSHLLNQRGDLSLGKQWVACEPLPGHDEKS